MGLFMAYIPKEIVKTEKIFDDLIDIVVAPLARKYNAKAVKKRTKMVKQLNNHWVIQLNDIGKSNEKKLDKVRFDNFAQELASELQSKKHETLLKGSSNTSA